MAALRPAGRGGAAGGAASARDSPMVDACQQLAALFAEHPDRRAIFLAQDGIVAIIELLEERSHKVLSVDSPCRLLLGKCEHSLLG